MRVTDRGMFEAAAARTQQARARVERAVDQTSTGQRVSQPWDDPGAARAIALASSTIERFDALQRTSSYVAAGLESQDAALSSVSAALERALELGVQMANATFDAGARAAAATEAEGLFRQVLGGLNREQGGRYLFGGNRDAAPPFDDTGAFVGDGGVRELEAAPGARMPTSIRTDLAFTSAGGGVEVPGALVALRDALLADDVEGIRASLGGLNEAIDQVGQARAQVGSLAVSWEGARAAARTVRDDTLDQRSQLSDVDLIEATTSLSLAERAFEAAIAASTKGFDLSLLKRL